MTSRVLLPYAALTDDRWRPKSALCFHGSTSLLMRRWMSMPHVAALSAVAQGFAESVIRLIAKATGANGLDGCGLLNTVPFVLPSPEGRWRWWRQIFCTASCVGWFFSENPSISGSSPSQPWHLKPKPFVERTSEDGHKELALINERKIRTSDLLRRSRTH